MNDLPRRKLCELIAQYGESLCDYPQRCEGLLRDLCPHDRREVYVLANALKARIGTDLWNVSSSVPTEMTLARLTKRLEDEQGLASETARWVVESWALALGKISEKDVRQREAANPAVTTSHQATKQSRYQAPKSAVPMRSLREPMAQGSTAPITYVPAKRGKGWLVALSIVALLCAGGAGAWRFKLLSSQKTPPTPATGAPKGDVEIALIWWNTSDLDLHVVDPNGEETYYSHKKAQSGGELDVEMNVRPPFSSEPVEHVYFPQGGAPNGHFRVSVICSADRASAPNQYEVEVKANGQRRVYEGSITNAGRSSRASNYVCEFDVETPNVKFR